MDNDTRVAGMTVPDLCVAVLHARLARHYEEPSLNSSSCEKDLHVHIPTNTLSVHCKTVASVFCAAGASTWNSSLAIRQQM